MDKQLCQSDEALQFHFYVYDAQPYYRFRTPDLYISLSHINDNLQSQQNP